MGWEEKGEGDWRGDWSTTPFLGSNTRVKGLILPMMDYRIVNGLASPVSLSPCQPELGAVEGTERLTSGLGKEVNICIYIVSIVISVSNVTSPYDCSFRVSLSFLVMSCLLITLIKCLNCHKSLRFLFEGVL